MEKKKFIIAIDGTAASGKGTIGLKLAKNLKFEYLDTGLLYRLVAFLSLEKGKGVIKEKIASEMSSNIKINNFNLKDLLNDEVAQAASKVAAIKSVRENLFQFQKKFPEKQFGSIIDGRDIGTVVFPNADVKFFITANENVRALRRYEQLKSFDRKVSLEKIKNDLIERDSRDYLRKVSPLKCHKNAYLIDTTNLNVKTSVDIAMEIIENKLQYF